MNATATSEKEARRPTSCRPHKPMTKATKVPFISDLSIGRGTSSLPVFTYPEWGCSHSGIPLEGL